MDKDSLSKVPSYMLNETNWALWKMKTVAFARAHKWEKILDGSLRASHFKRKLNSSIKEEELDLKSNDVGDEEIESSDINDKLNTSTFNTQIALKANTADIYNQQQIIVLLNN